MKRLLLTIIAVARRFLFHTKIGKSKFATRVYETLFSLSAPDLSQPVPFRGVELYVDPADRTCTPSIVAGYFEEKELDLFEALAPESNVFFDIGANIGLYSVLGCLKSPRLVAYAFEPVLENQRLLERNVALHGLQERVLLQPVAVSEAEGEATVHLSQSGTHSLEYQEGRPTRVVKAVTLDAFVRSIGRGPDILKIDVEGHELAVLMGAWDVLTQYRPTLLMEFIPAVQKDVGSLIERLQAVFTHCFVVDEITGSVVQRDIGDLHHQRSCNLVLTSNEAHAEIVASRSGALAAT